jgi:hypothetical protein
MNAIVYMSGPPLPDQTFKKAYGESGSDPRA